MTNELMSRFNMKGKRGKMGFQYTQLYGVIKGKKCYASFFPTALKGCWGIVFTHGVWMGWVGGGKKFVRVISQKP